MLQISRGDKYSICCSLKVSAFKAIGIESRFSKKQHLSNVESFTIPEDPCMVYLPTLVVGTNMGIV